MAVPIAQAFVDVQLNQKAFLAGLAGSQAAFTKTTGSMKARAAATSAAITKSFVAATAGLALLGGVVAMGVKSAASYETAWREVWTLMAIGEDQMKSLADATSRMSVAFGQSEKIGLKALYQITSAGFVGAEAMTVLEESLKGAVGGVSDVFTAADILTGALNAWNVATTQSARVMDIIFTTIKEGKVTMDSLAAGAGRVMAIAGPFGISMEEAFASLATLTKPLGGVHLAATALVATIRSFLKPQEELNELMGEMGYETGRALVEEKGLAGAIVFVKDAAEAAGIPLEVLFSNVRAMMGVMPLATTMSEEYARILDSMYDSAGATSGAVEKMMQSFEMQWSIFSETLGRAKRLFGEAFLPMFTAGLEKIIPYVEKLAEYFRQNGDAVRYFVMHAMKMLGIIVLVGGIAKAFTFLMTPVGALIAAAALLYGAWYFNLYGIREMAEKVGDTLEKAFNIDEIWKGIKEEDWGRVAGKIALDAVIVLGSLAGVKLLMAAIGAQMAAVGIGFTAAATAPAIGIGLALAATLALNIWLDSQGSTVDAGGVAWQDIALKTAGALAAGGIVAVLTKGNILAISAAATLAFNLIPSFSVMSAGVKENLLDALTIAGSALAGALGGAWMGAQAGAILGAAGGPAGVAVGAIIGTLAGISMGVLINVIVEVDWISGLRKALDDMFTGIEEEIKSSVESHTIWGQPLEINPEGFTLPFIPLIPEGKQLGGPIPGTGFGDTIPAMLEPGEFVVPNWMMQIPWLASLIGGIWSKRTRFQAGGPAGLATQMAGAGIGPVAAMSAEEFKAYIDSLNQSMPALLKIITNYLAAHGQARENVVEFTKMLDALFTPLGDLDSEFGDLVTSTLDQINALDDLTPVTEEGATALKSFADRLAEIQLAMVGTALPSLLAEMSTGLAEVLAGGKWGELASLLGEMGGLDSAVGAMRDQLERVITGDLDKDIKTQAEALLDSLGDLTSGLGLTFEELEQQRLEAAEAARRAAELWKTEFEAEVTEALRFSAGEMARGAYGMAEWRTYLEGMETPMASYLGLVVGLQSALKQELRYYEALVPALRAQGLSTVKAEEQLERLRVILGDAADGLGAFASALVTYGDVITKAAGMAFGPDVGRGVGIAAGGAIAVATGNIPGVIMAFLNAIEFASDMIEKKTEEMQEHIEDVANWLEETFNSIVNAADMVAESFYNLARHSEAFRQVQAGLRSLFDILIDSLFGFLSPLASILEYVIGSLEDSTAAIHDETTARESLYEAINVPAGFKGARYEWRAAIPGVPYAPPEPEPPGDEPQWPEGLNESLALFSGIIDSLTDIVGGFMDTMATAWESIMPSMVMALEPVIDTFGWALGEVSSWITDVFAPDMATFLEGFGAFWANMVDPFIREDFGPTVAAWIDRMYGWLDDIMGFFAGPVWDWVTGPFWDRLKPFVDTILGMFEAFGIWVDANWESTIEPFLNWLVEEWLGDMEQGLDDFLEAVKAFLSGAPAVDGEEDAKTFWEEIAAAMVGALEEVGFWDKVLAKIPDLTGGIGAGTFWGAVIGTLIGGFPGGTFWGAIVGAIIGFLGTVVWEDFIVGFVWDTVIVALVWEDFIVGFLWDTVIVDLIWSNFIVGFVWDTVIKGFLWDTVIVDLIWNNFIVGFLWESFIEPLGSWVWENVIVGPAQWVWANILTPLGSILEAAAAPLVFVFELIGNMIIGVINAIISLINLIPFVNIPHIPYLEKGGIVTSPTLAMVGEGGPEAVIPLGAFRGLDDIFGGLQSTDITLNITVKSTLVSDGREIAAAVGRQREKAAIIGGRY